MDNVSYSVYELDLYALKNKVLELGLKDVVVYGIGNNGYDTYRLLKNLDVNVLYYVDVKANSGTKVFFKKNVLSPNEFKEQYGGEYVIITPAIHETIVKFMGDIGVSKDKLIIEFYQTETITIDYGSNKDSIDRSINFDETEPVNPMATIATIVYNTPENLFRRAIESILKQSYRNFRYLIVINGATDNSYEIAKEYADLDKRILLINLDQNYPWTNEHILKQIYQNTKGKYWCQLDSDDYYADDFLEKSIELAEINEADIVHVRTCLFSADESYDPMDEGLQYDWHDKYYFNIVHPPCHAIGHKEIMYKYARSRICSTFWGKLYSTALMKKYADFLLELKPQDRELYFRLDIAMTYKVLSMAERVYFSDKVLHFSQYSKKNSTFTLAPIEWLMSLWYTYKGIKGEMYAYYKEKKARKYSKAFLGIHLVWMVARGGMLENIDSSPYREEIIENFREMLGDEIFKKILLKKKHYMVEECKQFYADIEKIVQAAQ